MRKTMIQKVTELENQIGYLKTQLIMKNEEVINLKVVNDAYKIISQHIPVATIALERITDAVAHVLGDLIRRPVK